MCVKFYKDESERIQVCAASLGRRIGALFRGTLVKDPIQSYFDALGWPSFRDKCCLPRNAKRAGMEYELACQAYLAAFKESLIENVMKERRLDMHQFNFSTEAIRNIEETGCNPEQDLKDIWSKVHTAESLLAHCLNGADEDREAGWRDYVQKIVLASERISTERLQDIRNRAAKILGWVNRTFDAGEASNLGMDSGTRNKANAWFFRFSLLAAEMGHAEYVDEPEQHREAVARIAKHYLQFIGEFDELETQYERAIGRSAEAANRALNLASGGVDDDGD